MSTQGTNETTSTRTNAGTGSGSGSGKRGASVGGASRSGRAPLVLALAALAAAPMGCGIFEDEPEQKPAPEKPAAPNPPKATRPVPKGEAPAAPAAPAKPDATSTLDSTATEATSGLDSAATSGTAEASGAANSATSSVSTSGIESSANSAATDVTAAGNSAASTGSSTASGATGTVSGATSDASSAGSSAASDVSATGGSAASGASTSGASAGSAVEGGASSAASTGASTASSTGGAASSTGSSAAAGGGSMAAPAASEARVAAPASTKGYVLAVRGGAAAPEWVASLGEEAGTVAGRGEATAGAPIVVCSGDVGCTQPRLWSVSAGGATAGKTIPGLGHATLRRAIAFGDGSTAATGSQSQGGDLAGQDLFLERFDSSGDPASFTTFGGPKTERGGVSCEAPNSGIFLAGSTSTGGQDEAAWVLRVAADGKPEWEVKAPADAGAAEEATDIAPAPDGGCVVVGKALSANKIRTTIWARRYGRDGKLKWAKAWAKPREVYGEPGLCEAQGGGAWIVAAPVAPDRAFSYGDWQTWAARLGDTGDAAWEVRVPGRGSCVVDTLSGPALAVVAQEGKARVVNIVELTPDGAPRSRTAVKAAGAAEPRVMRFADGAYVLAGPMQ